MAVGRLTHYLRHFSSKHAVSQVRVMFSNHLFHYNSFTLSNPRFLSSLSSNSLSRVSLFQLPPNLKFCGAKTFCANTENAVNAGKNDELVDNNGGIDSLDAAAVDSGVVNKCADYEGFEYVASLDAADVYRQLCELPKDAKMSGEEWDLLHEIFGRFTWSAWAKNQALAVYIGSSSFPAVSHQFRVFFTQHCRNDIAKYLLSLGSSDEAEKFLFPVFVEFCRNGGADYEGFEHVASLDAPEIYRQLCELPKDANMSAEEWDLLYEIFGRFTRSAWASNQALAIYIGASFFPTAAHKFRVFFSQHCRNDIAMYLLSLGPSDAAEKFLFPVFVEFCLDECRDEIKKFRKMVDSADLTKPHTWFPFARAMKRKIVYHCGPTNSGKTYNALQRFMEADKGIYCSPLRLLAMEVFDKVNGLGVYCSLLTGQEKKLVPFANHVACTVEMVSTDESYDVAVIDEIQMMADPCRGFAWTRALLGLKADEIHVCGDPSVLNIVRKICSDTGDELVEQHYGRFKPLVVEAKTLLGDLRNVKAGDCVVAFSRREIFEVKLAIEKQTKHRCCVIYGALPPETRRQQATLFNDHDNEFDVLVASDAVGMGLNLNIRRVVFYGLSKYNGNRILPVPASQVKQIAGRAGRRGSRYPDGLCTTLHLEDLDYLIECLKQPFPEVTKVGLFPFYEQVELFAGQLPNMTFAQLLAKFSENCRLDGSYFLCQQENIKKVANMLEKVPGLSLIDRYNFCFAPVNIRDPKAMYHLLRFASSYSQNNAVNIAMGIPTGSARNDSELLDLETKHQICSMYMWLSNHFKKENFPYRQRAEDMASNIAELLGQSLTKVSWEPEQRKNLKKKPEQKDGYERPQSIIKLIDRKRHGESSAEENSDKSKKVAV